ncbi:MAG: fibronectin type III domain-containing protein, partial [Limisphaerales bacterium]
ERDTFIYVSLVRDVLKKKLGTKYSSSWDSTGLIGSLGLPRTAEGLLPLLQSIKGHLTTNTGHAVEPLKVTVTDVTAQFDALIAKRNEVRDAKGNCNRLLSTRNEEARKLEVGLRVLLSELHKKLTPTDDRWVDFGFKKPGIKSTPEVPQNLSAILIGTTAIAMKWSAAPRADRYRVWKMVMGQDTEFVPVHNPADLDYTIEGLPGNSTVQVAVSAINNGGESKLSTAVTVNTL